MVGGGHRRSGSVSSSSSGEEDGDANWMAAISSVANTSAFSRTTSDGITSTSNGSISKSTVPAVVPDDDADELNTMKPQVPKHYQIKAQKLLDDILEKTIEIVSDPISDLDEEPILKDDGVQLFKNAPRGIVFDHSVHLQGPTKKPRLLPGKDVDESSKKFRQQLKSVAVDGTDIIAAANKAHQKALAKREAKEAAAKEASKREEERIAELKRIRGERWLPAIARDRGIQVQRQRQR